MELDHEFIVATDADTAWPLLLDVERVHPLLPGVVYESGEDGEYRGRLRLRFGPTTITYRGTVRVAVVDDLTRTAIFEVTARESRGPGTATGTFQATVHPTGPHSSRVTLHTRIDFTNGRAASLTPHLIHDTGTKLLTKFTTNLNTTLTPAHADPTEPTATEETSSTDAEPANIVAENTPPPPEPTPEETSHTDAEPTGVVVESEPLSAGSADGETSSAGVEPVETVVESESPVSATDGERARVDVEAVGADESAEAGESSEMVVKKGAGVAVEGVLVEGAGARVAAAAGRARPRALPEVGDEELDLYELTERTALVRRVLSVVGIVLVLVLLRRLARRR